MNVTNESSFSVRAISLCLKDFLYGLVMLVELVEEDAAIQMCAFALAMLISVVAICAGCCICIRTGQPEKGMTSFTSTRFRKPSKAARDDPHSVSVTQYGDCFHRHECEKIRSVSEVRKLRPCRVCKPLGLL